MNRVVGAIVYNWPLKLAAIALATLLYVGLIFSENVQTRDVSIPINAVGKSTGTILIGELGEVTNIRYFVADQANVTITSANFTAVVDLTQVQPGTAPQSVRVEVTSADPRVQVQSATPAFVSVHLEPVKTTDVSIDLAPGQVPDGLAIGDPQASLEKATVIGAATDIARVTAARANIPIDSSGIDVDRDIQLIPVDQLGERVTGVDVEPATVHVQMPVFKDRSTATVPITPAIVGSLATGFEVGRIEASPTTVSIAGDAADLANVVDVDTQPITLDGRTADFDVTVGFNLPQGIRTTGGETVTVHVQIRAVNSSRNFSAGIVLAGARADRLYSLSAPEALVTIGGSPADLDRLNGATIALTASVADLGPGTHTVPLSIQLQAGLTVVAISPASVTVTVSEVPAGSAAPSASGGG
ncbi:MAG TPA: CdaR family protein [Candidatus Limnocylindrales bacterium]|nr:CdaR family protein [Candidatus Limnocylindrales bacterium]